MADRRTLGSWLEGPASVTREPGDYPGRRLGLPEEGPGSVARFGRRLAALSVDWLLALLVTGVVLRVDLSDNRLTLVPVAVLTVYNALLVGLFGASVGHRMLGLKVVRLDGTEAGFGRGALRSVLLSLVVPAVVWDLDQRGLHDRFVGTVLRRV